MPSEAQRADHKTEHWKLNPQAVCQCGICPLVIHISVGNVGSDLRRSGGTSGVILDANNIVHVLKLFNNLCAQVLQQVPGYLAAPSGPFQSCTSNSLKKKVKIKRGGEEEIEQCESQKGIQKRKRGEIRN